MQLVVADDDRIFFSGGCFGRQDDSKVNRYEVCYEIVEEDDIPPTDVKDEYPFSRYFR